MSKEDTALGMVALRHAQDRIKPAQDELRRRAKALLAKKERVPAMVGDDVVGTIGKSSPKPVATVSDELELREWMAENYPALVVPVPFIEDQAAAIEVLETHAPHLVHTRRQVAESVVREMLANSEKSGVPTGPGGEADVPGIRVDTPEGNVSVLMEKGNEHLIEQLFTSGRVSLDGSVRKEIEA